jgi:hypothetical protein
LAGTIASRLEEVRPTTTPPVEAGPESLTVQIDRVPSGTVEGAQLRLVSVSGARSETVAVDDAVPIEAVITAT